MDAEARAPVEGLLSRTLPYHNLPPRDYERFVGRQSEQAELRRLLNPRSRAYVITIDGIGGIGKSALALETAYAFRDQYAALPAAERFDALVWVSAKRSYLTADGILERSQTFRTLNDLYAAIAQALDYPAITRARAEAQRAIVEDVLREQRTLLLLDNLETIDDEELLAFLRELPDPTKVLVTTRHRIDVAYPVRLSGMPHADALALIGQEAARKETALTPEEQEDLWARTGGVPLAIVWSIGLMGVGGSIASVLRRLGSGQSDIARFCFAESVAQIRGRDAYWLLLALSLFAVDASREALGVVAGLGEDEFGRDIGLEELLRLSLVNKEGERFSLLPLTKNFVVREVVLQGASWIEATKERSRDYYYQFVEKFGGWSSDWRGHDRVEYELPNLLATIYEAHAAVQYHVTSEGERHIAQASKPLVKWLLKFIRRIARTCRIRGYWDECEQLCSLAIDLARDIGESDPVGWRCYDIARISQYRGDLDGAQEWAVKALAEWQHEKYAYGICQARRVLGMIALRQGDLGTGHDIITSAFEAYTQLESQSGLPHFLGSLAELAEREGDLERALVLYQQTVDILQRENNTPYLASDLRNLGRVRFTIGAVSDARDDLEKSLRLAQECGRADVIAKTHYQFAIVDQSAGQPTPAAAHARQALELFRRLGMKHEQAEAEALLARLEPAMQGS